MQTNYLYRKVLAIPGTASLFIRNILNRKYMPKTIDLTGQTFGHLTVSSLVDDKSRGDRYWITTCSCGGTRTTTTYLLSSGRHTHCGCAPKPLHIDRTGQVFGRLTVISRADNSKRGEVRWQCTCSCGGTTITHANNLHSGAAKSCGCYSRELASTQGGRSRDSEYASWHAMVGRCTNPKDKDFHNYGGRGISICQEWQFDFPAFAAHIGPRPSPKHTVDRLDNDKGYAPGNVRWATPKEQSVNRRNTVMAEYEGRLQPLCVLAEARGFKYDTIYNRVHDLGWSAHTALNTPIRERPWSRKARSTNEPHEI